MGLRSPVVSLMLLLSMGSLYLYSTIGANYTANVAVMVLTGFLLGGPANTISSAITADLGKHEKIRGIFFVTFRILRLRVSQVIRVSRSYGIMVTSVTWVKMETDTVLRGKILKRLSLCGFRGYLEERLSVVTILMPVFDPRIIKL